jgi:hypothetical protein
MFGLIAGMAFFLEAGNGSESPNFHPCFPQNPSSLTPGSQRQLRPRPSRPPARQRCPQWYSWRHGQFRRRHLRDLVQIPRHRLFRELLDHGLHDHWFQPVDVLGTTASQGSDWREMKRRPGRILEYVSVWSWRGSLFFFREKCCDPLILSNCDKTKAYHNYSEKITQYMAKTHHSYLLQRIDRRQRLSTLQLRPESHDI